MKKNIVILIVDDEENQRFVLSGHLRNLGYKIFEAGSGEDALETVRGNIVDVVITDYKMPGMNGIELLKNLKKDFPDMDVVLITAHGSIDKAVLAMKEGAYDYLEKPVNLEKTELIIKRIEEKQYLISENKALKEQLNEKLQSPALISASGVMENVINLAARVSDSKASVLLTGESGTGKEILARAIHLHSSRKNKPFVAVNTAALTETLLESELFGHEKGSFTGADKQKKGRFEVADGGTVFLDEIGDIKPSTQVKLLRVLQEQQFERVGGVEPIKIDVRIIAATNRDLNILIKEGKFREDLYYRINVVNIHIPPLRERKEDIPALVEHFIDKYTPKTKKEKPVCSREAMDLLFKYNYPGNVRELENIIHHALVIARDNVITREDLPSNVKESVSENILNLQMQGKSLNEKVEIFETKLVLEALKKTNGNQTKAAELLGTTERNLRYRLEKWGLKSKIDK
ncbi:MAG: sigma-54-dependent Fis family transcriptional regulator [Ignavibacteria bacterium]|nr:sigma-54-dependent Fis family transcriptional regulator [Ignavibacteria bacterium]